MAFSASCITPAARSALFNVCGPSLCVRTFWCACCLVALWIFRQKIKSRMVHAAGALISVGLLGQGGLVNAGVLWLCQFHFGAQTL